MTGTFQDQYVKKSLSPHKKGWGTFIISTVVPLGPEFEILPNWFAMLF